jgi:hypothetical protein
MSTEIDRQDHLGEEMVIAWRQVWTVRMVVENLPVEELV